MLMLTYFIYIMQAWILLFSFQSSFGLTKYDRKDLESLREEVREMFQHAYDGYLDYAYPYDELRPLTCDGVDTWGSYSLTLIDALDTLAVMGNYTEFQRVVDIVTANANFDANINVSVFETNIRIIGGLLSAHMLSHRAGVRLVPGWPCNGPLLELAEDVARRLIAAFDTPTGMPYGTVNLQYGVPPGETTVTCTAGVGTFILELGTLSRLTGDPLFEEVALTALDALHAHRSPLGLVGNHVDVSTGRWTAQDAGIGAGVDSYYEYLAKGAILLQRPELMHMFHQGKSAIDKYLKRDDWHLWVSMSKGQVTLPVFQSLEAYWPGVLSLTGDVNKGIKSLHNYHQVWKQYGFTPEFYYIPQGEVGTNRESYPLRPELIESVMYLYRATGDPYLIEVGRDILRSIQHSAKTPCGYATIKDVRDHRKEDRMESFFLAETTKYLYLLFDPDNFLHNSGQTGSTIQTPWGECVVGAGGYIFNTEAHPIDPGALHCCSGSRQVNMQDILGEIANVIDIKGEPLSTHQEWNEDLISIESSQEDESGTFISPQTKSDTWKDVPNTQKDDPISSKPHIPLHSEFYTTEVVLSTQSQTDKIESTIVQVEETNTVVHLGDDIEYETEEDELTSEESDDVTGSREPTANSEDQPIGFESPSKNTRGEEEIPHTNTLMKLEDLPQDLMKHLDIPQTAEISRQGQVKEFNKEEDLPSTKSATQTTPFSGSNEWDSASKTIFDSFDASQIFYSNPLKNLQTRTNKDQTLSKLQQLQNSVDMVHKKSSMEEGYIIGHDTVLDFQPKQSGEDLDDNTYSLSSESEDHESDCTSSTTSPTGPENDCSEDFFDTDLENAEDEKAEDDTCKEDGDDCDKLSENLPLNAKYLWLLSSAWNKFDPQVLYERLQAENIYMRNKSWVDDHKSMSCSAQQYLQRLSMSGEMFEVL